MRKIHLLKLITCLCVLMMVMPIGSALAESTKSVNEDQQAIDAMLLAELNAGYGFDDPLVIVNPYGWTPLSAVLIFSTDQDTSVTMVVKGKDPETDLRYQFAAEKDHVLPVIGLYAGSTTQVELMLGDGSKNTIEITTEAVADVLTKAEVIENAGDNILDNQLLFCSCFATMGDFLLTVAGYDSKGDIRYLADGIWGTPFKQLDNGLFISTNREIYTDQSATSTTGFMVFDLVGKVYQEYLVSSGFHHDLTVLPNGNYVIDSSHEDNTVVNDTLLEIEADTGNVLWKADLSTILDVTDGNNLYSSPKNWFHCNSVDYDDANDAIVASGRMLDAVVSIDHKTNKVNWILGTKDGWTKTDPSLFFTPVEDNFEWQYLQHHATVLDNGDIMLFDNGGYRIKGTLDTPEEGVHGKDVYSRAVIYDIDTENMTISQVWEYGKERGDSWYSNFVSGIYEAEAPNAYWITSGGMTYSAELDSYDIPMFSPTGDPPPADRISCGLVDYVIDDQLLFELKLYTNVYRALPFDPSVTINQSLDLHAPGYVFNIDVE